MTTKQKRIRLLTEHRQRQLDERIAQLAERRQLTEQALSEERNRLSAWRQAQTDRAKGASSGVRATDWEEINDWVLDNRAMYQQAQQYSQQTLQQLQVAREAVLDARMRLKQVEKLARRLHERERRKERRHEQRAGDEHTSNALIRERLLS